METLKSWFILTPLTVSAVASLFRMVKGISLQDFLHTFELFTAVFFIACDIFSFAMFCFFGFLGIVKTVENCIKNL